VCAPCGVAHSEASYRLPSSWRYLLIAYDELYGPTDDVLYLWIFPVDICLGCAHRYPRSRDPARPRSTRLRSDTEGGGAPVAGGLPPDRPPRLSPPAQRGFFLIAPASFPVQDRQAGRSGSISCADGPRLYSQRGCLFQSRTNDSASEVHLLTVATFHSHRASTSHRLYMPRHV
jgi:hypothetical protein